MVNVLHLVLTFLHSENDNMFWFQNVSVFAQLKFSKPFSNTIAKMEYAFHFFFMISFLPPNHLFKNRENPHDTIFCLYSHFLNDIIVIIQGPSVVHIYFYLDNRVEKVYVSRRGESML